MVNYSLNTLSSITIDYTADCVAFCPIDEFNELLAVGSYQLVNDGKSKRVGRLYIFKFNNPSFCHSVNGIGGIFDIKWYSKKIMGKAILGVVTSEGVLHIYSYSEHAIILLKSLKLTSTGMCLHLDFSDHNHPANNPTISVTDSNGNIHLCKLTDECELSQLDIVNSHDYEAWVSHFSYWNSSILFTGGDDSLLKSIDLRVGNSVLLNKEHNGGVTSIESWFHKENLLLTGSYDESIRIFDLRTMKAAVNTVNIGGGVWRMRPHLTDQKVFLAACMYDGFKLCSFSENSSIDIIATCPSGDNLAYGIDWCKIPNSFKAASASFYDKKLSYLDIQLEGMQAK